MAEREIALLEQQLERLNDKKFDLDAWKNHTIIFMERIFGKETSKLKMIKALAYDYSSWNLRDTAATGKTNNNDPVILQAKEILSAAIAELKTLGLPAVESEKPKTLVLLKDELTGKQWRDLDLLLLSEDPGKSEKVLQIVEELEKEQLASIIQKLLTNPA